MQVTIKEIRLKLLFLLLLGLFLKPEIRSQQVIINEDPAIRQLMDHYVQWNKEEESVEGWRIQIINTDDRRKMEKALNDFRNFFPQIQYAKWKQVSPYYKVIVGAYESKLDALAFLEEVKMHFSSAIPVIEKIDKKEFLGLK